MLTSSRSGFSREASHWSMMEEPEKVNGYIREFITAP